MSGAFKIGSKGIIRVLTAFFLVFSLFDGTHAFAQVSETAGAQAQVSQPVSQPAKPVVLPSPGSITVDFKDVEINTVLHYLSEVSGVDIIPAPGVSGKVTMRLRDKPWETALDIVTRNYGYVYSREDHIIRVMPRGQLAAEETVTEVIKLSHLTRETELTKSSSDSSDEVGVSQTEISVAQLMKAIGDLLDTKRGEGVTFIPSVNSLVVTAIPSKMSEIKKVIAGVDQKPPQIVLDAKVVEITLDKDERFGIDWNTVITASGARRPITFPFTADGLLPFMPGDTQRDFYPQYGAEGSDQNQRFPRMNATIFQSPTEAQTANSVYSFGTLDFSTFSATLQLLNDRGDTEILSSPRITTLNNQKATIKVIDKIMLQKSVETTQTATLVTVEFESESDAREVGVKLAVIPHVNEEGEISVNLLPEVSSDLEFSVIPVGGADSSVALTYSSREANTIVRVKDGETIFLGGLIRKNATTTDNKVPVLGDIFGNVPGIGHIFKYEAEDITRTEIVFFVTVHIVRDGKDSVEFSQSQGAYDAYVKKEGRDKFGDKMKDGPGASLPFVKKGELSIKEKTEIVGSVSKAPAEEKKKRSFWDFRDKK